MLRNTTTVQLLIWCCLGVLMSHGLAAAQDDMEQETGVTVVPRFWLSSIDPIAGAVAKKEAYLLPMFGGTLSIRPAATPKFNVLLTALYGTGEGDVLFPGSSLEQSFGIFPLQGSVEMGVEATTGRTDAERFDIELLVRRIFPGRWFSLFFGPRYASWTETTSAEIGYSLAVNVPSVININESAAANVALDLESSFYGLEFGLGMLAEMTDSGQYTVFSNFVMAAAYTKWEATATVPGLDTVALDTFLALLGLPGVELSGSHFNNSLDANVGFQFGGDTLGYSLRYRVFLLVEENVLKQTQFTTIHGPEFGLAFRF